MSDMDVLKPKRNTIYTKADDVRDIIQHFIDIKMFPSLDTSKMAFLRSTKKPPKKPKKYSDDNAGKMEKELDEMKGKRKFIARVVTLNKFWKEIYSDKTIHWVIEVASENFDKLSSNDKLRVLIHEGYHIIDIDEPGKMRAHDEFSNISTLYGRYNELIKDETKKI